MAEENNESKADIKTPLGSLSFSGKRTAEFIAILSLCLLFLLAYTFWEHKTDAKEATKELIIGVKEFSVAQREMACIISLPQEQRSQSSAFCKTIARQP